MSPTYFAFTAVAVKSRPIRSGTFAVAGSATVVRCRLPQADAFQADGPHDPRDPLVIDHQAAVLAELRGDPRGAVGAVGVLVNLAYPGREFGLGGLPGRPCSAVRRQ